MCAGISAGHVMALYIPLRPQEAASAEWFPYRAAVYEPLTRAQSQNRLYSVCIGVQIGQPRNAKLPHLDSQLKQVVEALTLCFRLVDVLTPHINSVPPD